MPLPRKATEEDPLQVGVASGAQGQPAGALGDLGEHFVISVIGESHCVYLDLGLGQRRDDLVLQTSRGPLVEPLPGGDVYLAIGEQNDVALGVLAPDLVNRLQGGRDIGERFVRPDLARGLAHGSLRLRIGARGRQHRGDAIAEQVEAYMALLGQQVTQQA